jgi:hypothetical protein
MMAGSMPRGSTKAPPLQPDDAVITRPSSRLSSVMLSAAVFGVDCIHDRHEPNKTVKLMILF